MADQHFEVCERLLARARYDFFMTVDMGVDRIHHGFWKYMDARHPRYQPGSPFANAIHEYYHYIDGQVARLLKLVDDDTIMLVVSDHGGKVMLGGVCMNEWLIQEGYLVLHEYPTEPVPLERCQVDWSRTRAWGSGGYYGRLFLNVQGREPNGVIPAADYDKVRDGSPPSLKRCPITRAGRSTRAPSQPDAIYRESHGVPPDLLDLLRRSGLALGRQRRQARAVHLRERHRPG